MQFQNLPSQFASNAWDGMEGNREAYKLRIHHCKWARENDQSSKLKEKIAQARIQARTGTANGNYPGYHNPSSMRRDSNISLGGISMSQSRTSVSAGGVPKSDSRFGNSVYGGISGMPNAGNLNMFSASNSTNSMGDMRSLRRDPRLSGRQTIEPLGSLGSAGGSGGDQNVFPPVSVNSRLDSRGPRVSATQETGPHFDGLVYPSGVDSQHSSPYDSSNSIS